MPAYSSSAPGKIILFGEHAVVHGRPAIAVPVAQVRAKAIVNANPKGAPGEVRLLAPAIGLDAPLASLPEDQPLATLIRLAGAEMKLSHIPSCTIQISSTIPIAGGMGSGAAVSIATLRAFSACLGHPLNDEQVSRLAYEVEKIHHGTPSGIDNTVITYARPVYFIKTNPPELLLVKQAFTLVIADTGVKSPTAKAVGDVSRAWENDQEQYEKLFNRIGEIAAAARGAIEAGAVEELGPLMDKNHGLLRQMGVSSPELEQLVEAARSAGALGAKLSGAGRGGNMIALVTPAKAEQVAGALQHAGAVRTIITEVQRT